MTGKGKFVVIVRNGWFWFVVLLIVVIIGGIVGVTRLCSHKEVDEKTALVQETRKSDVIHTESTPIPTGTPIPATNSPTSTPVTETPVTEQVVKITVNQSVETQSPLSEVSNWKIVYYNGATSAMRNWKFPNLAPAIWPEFPNVDNGKYKASELGVEYGEDLDVFCQQDNRCNFVVAALHYREYTGDYDFEGIQCLSDKKQGCALAVFNVGNETAIFENETFYSGFTVTGRYWDGNFLPEAIWALLSHASNNMLNMDSKLNPTKITNAGANCGVPEGCPSVKATFIVVSGKEILLVGTSTVSK